MNKIKIKQKSNKLKNGWYFFSGIIRTRTERFESHTCRTPAFTP